MRVPIGIYGRCKREFEQQGYAENADALAAQYEDVIFAEAHRHTLHLLPEGHPASSIARTRYAPACANSSLREGWLSGRFGMV